MHMKQCQMDFTPMKGICSLSSQLLCHAILFADVASYYSDADESSIESGLSIQMLFRMQ
jgi:hypothetical protein